MWTSAEAMIEDLQSLEGSSAIERPTSNDFMDRQESTFLEVVRAWPPSSIPLSEPLICASLGRMAALARRPYSCFQTKDMSRMVLAKFAEYWVIARVILSKAHD
jgi:hypothetical protein